LVPAGIAIVLLIGLLIFGGLTVLVGHGEKVQITGEFRRPELYDWEKEGDL